MFKNFIEQIRLNHWLKNFLIFLPAISSQNIFRSEIFFECLMAFISFGFIASAIYLINDIIDIKKDKLHPYKKFRPLASGKVDKNIIYLLVIIFLILGLFISFYLAVSYFFLLLFYIILNFFYFFYFKNIILLDVFILMLFYLIRVIGGHLVNNIEYSIWLISFVFFLFLSLSILKKYSDIILTNGDNRVLKYTTNDLSLLQTIGLSCACTSSLVLLLYCNSESIKLLYKNEFYLIFVSPIVLYWILNTWNFGIKKQIKTDPVSFVARKGYTYITVLLILILLLIAKI